jgi:hypothetical protein
VDRLQACLFCFLRIIYRANISIMYTFW